MSLTYRLRHRIEFQEPVDTQDATTGDPVRVWQTVSLDSSTLLDEVPAEVLTGPGRESRQADTGVAETTARIMVRWFPGLSQAWRILWDGRTYDITSIDTDRTGRLEWRIRCTEGATDGR